MFSCGFPKTFITNSTAWSFTATLLSIHMRFRLNTYQGQWQFPFSHMLRYFSIALFLATSSKFLRVSFFKVSQELLVPSSSFFRADAFFEELLFQNSHFFPAFFPQNIYLFRANLLPRNQSLRAGNSLLQLPFRTATHRRHLQKSYFFEADSSAQHQLFQKKQDFEKGYFFRKVKFRISYFFGRATFLMTFLLIATFYSSYIYRRTSFLQHTFLEELLFHRYPSFPQLYLLLINH